LETSPPKGLDLKGVTHLTFDGGFNQPVERLDLKGVTHLAFGHSFNQPVEAIDLKGVTHLTFGLGFTRSIARMRLGNVRVSCPNGEMTERFDQQIRHSQLIDKLDTINANFAGLAHFLSSQ
jgi:hypothetical protein